MRDPKAFEYAGDQVEKRLVLYLLLIGSGADARVSGAHFDRILYV